MLQYHHAVTPGLGTWENTHTQNNKENTHHFEGYTISEMMDFVVIILVAWIVTSVGTDLKLSVLYHKL